MEHVKLREKIGYGLGDAASSMFWKLFTMYLLFFYTDVVGISAAVVGTMFLITRIWDTFLDPFIGILGDRTHSRFGKFRPYLLWGAIPFGLCGILTFSSWGGDSEISKIVYAYVTYTLMMMVYSFVNVPYASLLGVMSPDPQARTSLSSYRMTFAFGGEYFGVVPDRAVGRYIQQNENSRRRSVTGIRLANGCRCFCHIGGYYVFPYFFVDKRTGKAYQRRENIFERRCERFGYEQTVVDSFGGRYHGYRV